MPGVIRLLMEKGSEADDVVVPVINGYYEPLCAIYSQSCLPLLSRLLEKRQAKISGMFSRVRVHMVQEAEVRTVDPHLDSFFNVNTPEDLFTLQKR
jgi:molybdopterin-guanine dinucleotide biosynthesis protein A